METENVIKTRYLPQDHAQRMELHNEVHARPQARIRLPALVVYVAVDNEGISREAEWAHLQRLPGQEGLTLEQMQGNFVRLRLQGCTLKWERHTEFTRYSVVQSLPESGPPLGTQVPDFSLEWVLVQDWLHTLPGRTIAAIELAMLHGDVQQPDVAMDVVRQWLGDVPLVASVLGNNSHSWVATDLLLRPNGFERMVVISSEQTTPTRAGRMAQRLLEIETYRLIALRGLPVAKSLASMLSQSERDLADITAQMEDKSASDQALLETLVALAARVERATARHVFRFSATRAYHSLVVQRIGELREKAIPGTQTLGEFMQRRLSPAMATVEASGQRLASLSERVARTSALLRTRVDIATELQNQQLLEKLTRGQDLQLQLQSMVEGLSIAAISYYVVSLLLYVGKALKVAGVPLHPEALAGASIPLVLWGVWKANRRIHRRLHEHP